MFPFIRSLRAVVRSWFQPRKVCTIRRHERKPQPRLELLEDRLAPATITWDGLGLTNNWSEGANWSGGVAPGTADTAVFNGTSTKNCVLDNAATSQLAGLEIDSPYTGTLTLQQSLLLTSSLAGTGGTIVSAGSQTLGLYAPYRGSFSADYAGTIQNLYLTGNGGYVGQTGNLDVTGSLTGSDTITGTIVLLGNASANATVAGGGVSFQGNTVQDVIGTYANLDESQTTGGSIVLTGNTTVTNDLTGSGSIIGATGAELLELYAPYRGSVSTDYTGTIQNLNLTGNGGYVALGANLDVTGSLTGGDTVDGTIVLLGNASANATVAGGGISLQGNTVQDVNGSYANLDESQTAGGSIVLTGNTTVTNGLTGSGSITSATGAELLELYGPYRGNVSADYTGTIQNLNLTGNGGYVALGANLDVTGSLTGGDTVDGTIVLLGNASANATVAGGGISLQGNTVQDVNGTYANLDESQTTGGSIVLTGNTTVNNDLTGSGSITGATGAELLELYGPYRGTVSATYTGTIQNLFLTGNGGNVALGANLDVTGSLTGGDVVDGTIVLLGNASANATVGGGGISLQGNTVQDVNGSYANLDESQTTGGSIVLTGNTTVTNDLTGSGSITGATGAELLELYAPYRGTVSATYTGTIQNLFLTGNGGNVALGANLDVTGSLTGGGTVGGTIVLLGDASANATVAGGTVSLQGNTVQDVNGSYANLDESQTAGGSIVLTGNTTVTNGLTGSGSITGATGAELLELYGPYRGNVTADYTGTVQNLYLTGNGGYVALTQSLNVTGTLSGGGAVYGNINLYGNVVGASIGGYGSVTLVGSTNQSLTGSGSIGYLNIAKPSGNVLWDSSFSKTFTQLQVLAGQWDVLGNTITVTGGFIAQGGTIDGAGTLVGSLTVNSGGELAPGDASNPYGSIAIDGGLTFNSGATYSVDINGNSQFSQTVVNGTNGSNGSVNISTGATLTGTTTTRPSSPISIITHEASESGNFASAHQNAVITVGGSVYQIKYNGGAGNDVTLTPALFVSGASSSVTVNEGQTATNSGSFSDIFPGAPTVAMSASVGIISQTGTASGTWSWSYATNNPGESQTVIITATDTANNATATFSFPLTVNDVAPTFNLGGNSTSGPNYALATVPFTDPGAETWSGTVNYGDGSGNQSLSVNQSAKTFSLNHTYATAGTYTVSVSLSDGVGGVTTNSIQDTVVLNPTIASDNSTVTAFGGSPAANTGTFNDPAGNSNDTLTASVGTVTLNDSTGAWSWSIPTTASYGGPYTVTITDSTSLGGSAQTSFTYSVANPLTAGVLTPPSEPGGTPTATTFINGSQGLSDSYPLAFDAAGNLYIGNVGNGTVLKATPAGVVTTFASGFDQVEGLAFDPSGNLYVSGYGASTVWKVTPSGAVSIFASGSDNDPDGLAFDASGNLYVSNFYSGTISKVTPGGVVSTFASGLTNPRGLAFDTSGNLFVANYGAGNIDEVTPTGAVSTYLPGPQVAYLAFDAAGNLYIPNYGSGNILEVTPAGAVSTYVNGVEAVGAAFNAAGSLFFSSAYFSNTVSEVTPGIVPVTEGQAFSQTVFHFSDANASATASSITALVTLGNGSQVTLTGTPSANGQIVADSGGGFDVQLSYTYPEYITNQTFSVSVTDASGNTVSASDTSFSVADAPLTGTNSATAIGGVAAVTEATLSGATFTDGAGSYSNLSDFSVQSVNWGDGSTSTAGLSITGTNGNDTVNGSHLYATAGVYDFSIVVNDVGGNTVTITGSTTVAIVASPGYYAPVGSPIEYEDPAGTYSAAGASSATQDSAGTYSAAGASSATTDPAGTYSGPGAAMPTPADPGTYIPGTGAASIAAEVADPVGTYSGAGASSATAFPANTLGNLNQTYTGSPESATATLTGLGTSTFTFTYNGSSTPPTNAGTYTVVATLVNANYAGTVTGTLVIAQASAKPVVTAYCVVYNGQPQTATAMATDVFGNPLPAGDFNLTGTTHTSAGTYAADTWTFSDPSGNYLSACGTISDIIHQAAATVAVTPYCVTYDGNAHTATATASGVGGVSLPATDFTLTGTTHANAGTYGSDGWSFADANYVSQSGTVMDVIHQAAATVSVMPYSTTYNAAAHSATGTATGLANVNLSADLNLTGTTHTNAGTYSDSWSFIDPNGNYASASGNITDTINKACATISVTPYSTTYNAAAHTATGTATGVGSVNLGADLNLSGTTHTNAGTYSDSWSFIDPNGNYASASGNITDTINKATATVTLGSLSQTYTGMPISATATTSAAGTSSYTFTYNGSSTPPTAAGSYTVAATLVNANYQGNATGTLVIGKATATVTLGSLSQTYSGSQESATATTSAAGTSSFAYTYNGSATPPTNAGSYTVVATLSNADYQGSATGTLVIAQATLPVVVSSDLMLFNGNYNECGGGVPTGWGVCGVTPATLSNVCFTDFNDCGPLSDFHLTAVSWGDGCTDTSSLSLAGCSGNYSIGGSHLYTLPGIYTVCVHVVDRFGQTSVITSSTTVCDQYGNAPGTPALTGTVNTNPFTNITSLTTSQGDVLTVALSSTVRANSPVGTYPITATVIGAASANYVAPAPANMYVVTIGQDSGTGARGVSFWDNSGDAKLITAADLASLDTLNLVSNSGTSFNPTTASQLQNWLQTDTNGTVATFLSAQLATMDLNVLAGNVQASAEVYAGDLLQFAGATYSTTGLDTGGFITVANLMTLANNALAQYQTPGSNLCNNGVFEAYMLVLADALQAANNNASFAQ